MSDPITPFLKLTKPIVNDEAGEDLWGDKLNRNFDTIDTFAASQGALSEAPTDSKLYGRIDRAWAETVPIEQYLQLADDVGINSADITSLENGQIVQDNAISTKAPLGPSDGAIYGWKDSSWYQVSGTGGMTVTWDQVTGKPPTYPPTLPIPESGVTGLSQKQADQDAAIAAINWNSLSGKPATYPPTLPIPSSGVTGLDAKQTSQDTAINTKIGDAPAGGPYARQTGAWVAVPPSGVPEAPTDGQLYSRKGSTASWVIASAGAVVADTPPVGMPVSTIWWNSSNGGLFIDYQDPNTRQWVMVNAPGMPEANKDGKTYARKDGAWFDITASLDKSGYLPLAGGSMTGPIIATPTTGSITAGSGNSGLEVRGAGGAADAAYMSFHRPGAYAVHFGLDTDNQLFIGGWSMSGVRNAIWHTGNLTPSNYAPVGGVSGGFSANYFYGTVYLTTPGYITCPNTTQGGQYSVSGSGSSQAGGVLGYGAGNQYYGIVGYNAQGNAFWGSGRINTSEEIHASSYVRSLGQTMIAVGHPLISSTANAYMNSGGTLQRISSSSVYKTGVESMEDTFGDKVLQLRPVFYRPQFTNDYAGWSRFGFIAEECHAIDHRFAETDRAVKRDEKGKTILAREMKPVPNPEHLAWTCLPIEERGPMPEPDIMEMCLTGEPEWDDEKGMEQTGLDLNGIVAALVNLVQRQNARIQALEAKVGV